jgi:hypothetical protein
MANESTISSLRVAARMAADRDLQERETQAQVLAALYQDAILSITPGSLPQSEFLSILSAVLGRFVAMMAHGDPAELAEAVAELVIRHSIAGQAP